MARRQDFTVTVHKEDGQDLGMTLKDLDNAMEVQEISPGGLIDKYNKEHPRATVHIGDHVTEVNESTVVKFMRKFMDKKGDIKLRFVREVTVHHVEVTAEKPAPATAHAAVGGGYSEPAHGMHQDFTVTVHKDEDSTDLGMKLKDCDKFFHVEEITEGGLVKEYNKAHPRVAVHIGDHITEVNGVTGCTKLMSKFLAKKGDVKLRFVRDAAFHHVEGHASVEIKEDLQHEQQHVAQSSIVCNVAEQLTELPVEEVSDLKWLIKGVTQENAFKLGLRMLEERWDSLGLPEKKPKPGHHNLAQGLLDRIAGGAIDFKAVNIHEIANAAADLKHLPVKELLQLKVKTQEVHAPSSDHETFLHSLDEALLPTLGRIFTGSVDRDPDPEDAKTARELLEVLAATTAVKVKPNWAVWVKDHRYFFDMTTLKASSTFPGSGVLEICDHSKERSGTLWLEWHVHPVTAESDLMSLEQHQLQGGFQTKQQMSMTKDGLNEALHALHRVQKG